MQWLVLCMRKQPHKYSRSNIGCKYISGIHVPSFISIYSVCISIMVIIIMKLSLLYLPYSSPCTFPDFNDFIFPKNLKENKYFLFRSWKWPSSLAPNISYFESKVKTNKVAPIIKRFEISYFIFWWWFEYVLKCSYLFQILFQIEKSYFFTHYYCWIKTVNLVNDS